MKQRRLCNRSATFWCGRSENTVATKNATKIVQKQNWQLHHSQLAKDTSVSSSRTVSYGRVKPSSHTHRKEQTSQEVCYKGWEYDTERGVHSP